MEKSLIDQAQESARFKGKYYYATGRRKNAVARVRIYPEGKDKTFVINKKDYKKYFPTLELTRIVEDSQRATNYRGKISVSVNVLGGGKKGQAEATRLGIARSLVEMDESLKTQLREQGFLTRDPRVKERKKPGLKKARRAPQWQKR